MKIHRLFILLMFSAFGNIFCQFTLEKFISEKFENYDNKRVSSMSELTKKTANETIDKIAVKIDYINTKDGKIMKQVLSTLKAKPDQIKKLFDAVYAEIVKKFGKSQNEEEISGTKNCFWRAADGTIATLARTNNMTMLTMMKMQ
jgi:RNase adaptor protein for sRNA GlmZ degradation